MKIMRLGLSEISFEFCFHSLHAEFYFKSVQSGVGWIWLKRGPWPAGEPYLLRMCDSNTLCACSHKTSIALRRIENPKPRVC